MIVNLIKIFDFFFFFLPKHSNFAPFVSPAESWERTSLVKIDGLDIEETIKWCLSEFRTCINMAALWDKNNA